MQTATLRLHCADRPGIVFRVSQFIYELGGNILTSQQHCEQHENRFFMRVHFDRSAIDRPHKAITDAFAPLAAEFEMDAHITFDDDVKRMAIMVSKYDHCLYDLFLRHQYGELPATIALIASNHPDLAPVAERFETPFVHIPVTADTRDAAESRALDLFAEHRIDFIVLARYMQILTPRLIGPYVNRIINVHHGFLPAFKGARPYHQAYERGVKLIGATSHYVNEDLDNGPIIAQETEPVTHGHSVEAMLARGRDVERQVLAHAVQAHIQDRIMVYKNRTIVFDA